MTKSQFQTLPLKDRLRIIDSFIDGKNDELSTNHKTRRVEPEDVELEYNSEGVFIKWRDPFNFTSSQSPRTFKVKYAAYDIFFEEV